MKGERGEGVGGAARHLRASDIDDAEHPVGHICHRVIVQREPTPHARQRVKMQEGSWSATRTQTARVPWHGRKGHPSD